MRILWVKVGGLWPLDTGGRLRTFHIVSELAKEHHVTLMTTHRPGENPDALQARLGHCKSVLSFPHDPPKQNGAGFARTVIGSWLSPLPVDLFKWQVPALRAEVARMLGGGAVDLCVADFLYTTPNVPLDGPVPAVFFDHNVEHVIWQRLSRVETSPWRRALLELEWRKVRRAETRACAQARLTVAVSDLDQRALAAAAPGARVCAVPTGVDTAYFAPNGRHEAPDSIVFTGSMDWYPNEDAILHFIDAILPEVRRHVPHVAVSVVGRNPSARLRVRAAQTGVSVSGTVDDVRPYVAEAAVVVVPLRVGGGTRLKIFEALAMGKAVVSTGVGAEGLPLVPGEHFVRADAPADFAQAVVTLLGDAGRRRALGEAGRRLVEERYAWPQVAREFAARCEAAVAQKADASC